MNSAWKKLPKDVQKVMDDLSVEQARWTGEYMDNHVNESIKWSKETYNIEIIELSAEEMAKWNDLIQPLTAKWIEDAKGKGLSGDAIVADIKAFMKKY